VTGLEFNKDGYTRKSSAHLSPGAGFAAFCRNRKFLIIERTLPIGRD